MEMLVVIAMTFVFGVIIGWWSKNWYCRRYGSHLYWAVRRWYRIPTAIMAAWEYFPNRQSMAKALEQNAWFNSDEGKLYQNFIRNRYSRPCPKPCDLHKW